MNGVFWKENSCARLSTPKIDRFEDAKLQSFKVFRFARAFWIFSNATTTTKFSGSRGGRNARARRPFGRTTGHSGATRCALGTTSREKERDRADFRGEVSIARSQRPNRWNMILRRYRYQSQQQRLPRYQSREKQRRKKRKNITEIKKKYITRRLSLNPTVRYRSDYFIQPLHLSGLARIFESSLFILRNAQKLSQIHIHILCI